MTLQLFLWYYNNAVYGYILYMGSIDGAYGIINKIA